MSKTHKLFILDGVQESEYRNHGTELHVWARECGDGYHSFGELYDHRRALCVALFKLYDNYITPLQTHVRCWKSKKHSDGTMFEGYFIVGMTIKKFDGTTEQISYHYAMEYWDDFKLMEVPQAPEYDGHTSQDVIKRLMEL